MTGLRVQTGTDRQVHSEAISVGMDGVGSEQVGGGRLIIEKACKAVEVGGAGVRCHLPEGILQRNGPLNTSEWKQIKHSCFLTSCGDVGKSE